MEYVTMAGGSQHARSARAVEYVSTGGYVHDARALGVGAVECASMVGGVTASQNEKNVGAGAQGQCNMQNARCECECESIYI